MAKKTKIIKRVYEKGEETVIPSFAFGKRPAYKPQPARSKRPKRAKLPKVKTAATQPKHYISQSIQESYSFPSHYGATSVTLIAKDPYWVYAFWEIAQNSIDELRAHYGNDRVNSAKSALRMYDVTLVDFNGSNANSFFDIEVGPHTNNWYVNLWKDNIAHIAEIGLKFGDGHFHALARSNSVQTPRVSFSWRSEQIWMNPETKDLHVEAEPLSKSEGTDIPGLPQKKYDKKITFSKKKFIFDLLEDDIRLYYSKLNPLLWKIISARLSRKYGQKYGRFILQGETEAERRALLSRYPKDLYIRRILLGASESIIFLGASENMPGASDFVSEKIKQRRFFFELNAEVILYGRTEADASVYLGDKKIPLKNDGTFSVRFSLPDGKLSLPFKAVSADKEETRKIDTDIERRTI